ncbi:hypothetical protein Lbys_3280 [Leadbetterella byssophila DSM 17132]|uniref:DUF4595 domain-containing protein n=1 Tax=Leadbetterella byssophila (strain DSM 17132 / JCM 16389 / KACC 11308 / NBRC 106382 / 4M15) TaxID=649349 RepID=E4RWJ9_LEAB4|nr:hypothetical protein [Leadbetterella byssophila]ADQ18093.1 hypothetical protein Lbys_2425 [Leadbetterella byssophila DSM 17132]ADQ18939.1 hypothetical protein Lbys_3280 [Leadbetterella byssophila DSM 17132]
MRYILLQFFTICFLSSCKEDRRIHPTEPGPAAVPGLLKKISAISKLGNYHIEFSYMDSLTLKSIIYNYGNRQWTETFHYKNDTLRTSISNDTTKFYEYKDGKLSSIVNQPKLPASEQIIQRYYYLEGGNKVTHIIREKKESNEVTQLSNISLIWRGGNVGFLRLQTNNFLEEYDFQYGSGKNPLHRVYRQVLRIPGDHYHSLSENLISNINLFLQNSEIRIESTLNNQGYPSEQIIFERTNTSSQEWKEKERLLYEYYE